MSRSKEALDEIRSEIATPTKFATEWNKYGIPCGVCAELFYVDETTYNHVRSAMDFDPTNNSFCCDDCKTQYDEEAIY